jgi:dynein intermediate chain 1
MQWILYDAYEQDYEAQQREREKDKKDKIVSTQKLEVKRKDLETTSDITSRTLLAMKTLERMVNQNTFDEIAQGMSCKMYIRCFQIF